MAGGAVTAPATPAARSGARTRARAGAGARALRFTTVLVCICLFLQRFGVPLGSKPFSLVGPLGLALAGWALAQGTLAVHRIRLACFLVLAICVAVGLLTQGVTPGQAAPNMASMSQFLLLTSFAVLSFAEPVDEARFFRIVAYWFAVIAACGIAQFLAQAVGVRIFAFTGILPTALLYESGYNLIIPVGAGDLLKSNGFFLIEPSTFSQIMALGLIIEILAFRRAGYLALFAAGLLLSFSGTGWIVLASFVIAAVLGMGWRGIAIGGGTVLLLGLLLGFAWFAMPDFAHVLQGRMDEFSQPGTSGHRRFITPFWALSDTLHARPSVALTGLGSGVSEKLELPYEYDVNTPIKVGLEYGVGGLLAYVMLFLAGRRSPIQAGLLVPACTLFFFAGAYQQFPPVIFLTLLLTSVARLVPADAGPASRLRARPAIAAA